MLCAMFQKSLAFFSYVQKDQDTWFVSFIRLLARQEIIAKILYCSVSLWMSKPKMSVNNFPHFFRHFLFPLSLLLTSQAFSTERKGEWETRMMCYLRQKQHSKCTISIVLKERNQTVPCRCKWLMQPVITSGKKNQLKQIHNSSENIIANI